MKTRDIIIIGGGPAGVIAAVNARKNNPNKKILLIREKKISVIPCGIPYIFNRLKSVNQNILPDSSLKSNNIDLMIGTVESLDLSSCKVLLKNDIIKYEKLILATGSKCVELPVEGSDKKGIWLVKKDFNYLKKLRKEVLKSKNIVIIGGGFIGLEFAEELSSLKGCSISIVEQEDFCLKGSFDSEFIQEVEDKLKKRKVKLFKSRSVKKFLGENKVSKVKLDNNKEIKADLVIVSIGARPNVGLVKDTDIKLGDYGGIFTDKYMRTNFNDVFAVGDCAETRDFFTGKNIPIMLASTATSEARVAGANLYNLNSLKKDQGTIVAFGTKIDNMVLGSVGITKNRAKQENFKILSEEIEVPNHHPGNLPNTEKIKLKLIFSKTDQVLIGGQIRGPESVCEMINILALAIQKKVSLQELSTLQVATHPLLSSAPTTYPIIKVAQKILWKINK